MHVPYNGSSAVIPDLLTGRVEVTFAPAAFVQSVGQGRPAGRTRRDVENADAHAPGSAERQ